MASLTEEMAIARSRQSDLFAIKKLNCWGMGLDDVSILRRLPNVEVLALSINKIRSLVDFAACRRLRELYLRKNEIRDLSEIRYLRPLPDLINLWIDENPCAQHPEYRMTVLKNLPNLEKLDNEPVHPDEVAEAMRRGIHYPDSDDEGYPQQETYVEYRRQRSCESSPERDADSYYTQRAPPHDQASDSSEAAIEPQQPERADTQQCTGSPPRRAAPGGQSPEDDRYEHPAAHSQMSRSHYDARSVRSPDEATLRHSLSTLSVKEYSYGSNGESRYGDARGGVGGVTSPPQQCSEPYYERTDRPESCQKVPQRCPASDVWDREREGAREYPSAVMAEHRGFTRRPVTRNSNLLSAVLCLIKELDYPSLEVVEMAIRCRMDELANSQ